MNRYSRTIKGVEIDVYDLLEAYQPCNKALDHLIKKALMAGERGHKDRMQDLQDIIDSAIRAKQIEEEKQEAEIRREAADYDAERIIYASRTTARQTG